MKWLLLLLSFNLYAQYDPREYITSVASDPVADTVAVGIPVTPSSILAVIRE